MRENWGHEYPRKKAAVQKKSWERLGQGRDTGQEMDAGRLRNGDGNLRQLPPRGEHGRCTLRPGVREPFLQQHHPHPPQPTLHHFLFSSSFLFVVLIVPVTEAHAGFKQCDHFSPCTHSP